ncbi:FAD binding domain-containing protein [Ancylobacter lacus]|uniref:FAD binding domain-containing protein n=1 Tax=Ancylobacter lacus TaxID=2579970 RepID=UPI001BCF978B|nr:FAD binding domain-containing protein [Ancylobacter lacus]MBS7539038.1 FAD binding domain-containing protein [Ancylobacter lacus]
MDLHSVEAVSRPRSRSELGPPVPGEALLAGGTWLFSEPQPSVRRLVDLTALGWEPIRVTPETVSIAATCTIAELAAFRAPDQWRAAGLIGLCCRSFLASFKIWNTATVGGNICMGLPAGPMISLAAALDGEVVIWARDGGERRMRVVDFIHGPLDVELAEGEVVRSIELPVHAFHRRCAFRRASLSALGRSGVLVIGTWANHRLILTVTAATRRPVQIRCVGFPTPDELALRLIEDIPTSLYYDDVHGRPEWRRHLTREFALEIRDELQRGMS